MTRARHAGLDHDHAAAQPARNGDEITEPLPDYVAPVAPPSQMRLTLPFDPAAPTRPALPFRTTVIPAPLDVAPLVPPYVKPAAAPRRRRSVHLATAAAVLALYCAVLVLIMLVRHTMNVPAGAEPAVSVPMPIIASTSAASASPPAPPTIASAAPTSSMSASPPAVSTTVSAAAPRAIPPAPAPLRTTRPPAPAPARSAKRAGDVVNPWID
jgi:hypothetical protein